MLMGSLVAFMLTGCGADAADSESGGDGANLGRSYEQGDLVSSRPGDVEAVTTSQDSAEPGPEEERVFTDAESDLGSGPADTSGAPLDDASSEDISTHDAGGALVSDSVGQSDAAFSSDVSASADVTDDTLGEEGADVLEEGPLDVQEMSDALAIKEVLEDDASDSPDTSSEDAVQGDDLGKGEAGWRLTFWDDFEGPSDPGDPCYDQSQTPAMCMDRYWSQEPCPEDVHAQLAQLNKCVWSVYDIYNWMDWDKPFGVGINKLDRRSVSVEDGELVLSASLNSAQGEGSCGVALGDGKVSHDCPIHSGAVTSKAFSSPQGFQQAYGRWEVRARLPKGPGAWPAHWLLPQSGGWPDAGEIDIMEAIAEKPSAVHGSFHGGTFDNEIRTHHSVHYWHDPEDDRVSEAYHVYAVEWTPSTIRFFVDDLQIGILHEGTLLETKVNSAPDESIVGNSVGLLPVDIPDSPFHWILNTSIVPTGGLEESLSNFVSMSHRIDWVKVFEACTTDELDCVPRAAHSARVTEDPTLNSERWSAQRRRIHVGDFDGDGLQDLLMRARKPEEATYWLPGAPGLETFQPAVDISQASGMTPGLWADAYRDLVVGDFDNDGADDLLMLPRGEWHAAYQLLGGAAPFEDYSVVTESWGMSNALWSTLNRRTYAADFSGDGNDDLLLVALNSSDASYLLVATGEGGFNPPTTLGNEAGPSSADWSDETHSVSIGDFDGDGAQDVLLQGDSASVDTWLMLGDGAGGFVANTLTDSPWMSASKWSTEWRDTHVGDFNGDGASDLLLQSKGVGHATYLLISDGESGFAPEIDVTDAFWMTGSLWLTLYRQGLVGDFDGDGVDDLLLVSRELGHATYFLRADAQGSFEPHRVVSDMHMLSEGLWSTERHEVYGAQLDGGERSQVLLQGSNASENSYWVDLRGAL